MNPLKQSNLRMEMSPPPTINAEGDYFDYLRQRSRLAWLYRKYYLYPRMCRHLNGKVLDVGCGIGDFLAFRPNTIGVDINPHTIEWCRKRGLQTELMMQDVLPFQLAQFDGVVIDNVIEHIQDPSPLLSEIYRVLKPQGKLLIGVPGQRGYVCDADHKVFYDEDALVERLARADFAVKRVFAAPFKSAWLDRRMRQYCVYGLFERN